MEMHAHARLELVDAKPDRLSPALVDGLDDVIRGGLDERAISKPNAVDRLDAIRLDRDNPGCPARVVDLAAELFVLDDPSDRDHPIGRRDERVVGLTRRALRALLEADVEPDRRV